jgi:hypothetical protein
MIGDDLTPFFQHFGLTVAWGSVTDAVGILDMPDRVIGGGEVVSTDYQLTTWDGRLAPAKYGDAMTVDGIAYTVLTNETVDDGKIRHISLSKT